MVYTSKFVKILTYLFDNVVFVKQLHYALIISSPYHYVINSSIITELSLKDKYVLMSCTKLR